jgi:DNA repair exonuclease SbcCD ATPase subunit
MAKRPGKGATSSKAAKAQAAKAQVKRDVNKAFAGPINRHYADHEKNQGKIDERKDEIRKLRREASKLAATANKRVARLEKNNLQDSPAYQTYVAGNKRFGVKGKTYNEVQQELSRLKGFINSKSSTIRGVNNTLKEMAANTGIKYRNLKELRKKSTKFFELASKVEQYLRNVEDMASAIGYQKIWEAINEYTQDSEMVLDSGEGDIDSMVKAVTDALTAYDRPISLGRDGWVTLSSNKSNR